jgi:hypothetical protein
MKYKKGIHFFLIIAVQFIVCEVFSQNMNSPYSIYGIGDIDFRPYNRTSGMGGTGLALRSSYFLIDNNPAAISGLTRSFYIVDAAVTGKSVKYSGEPINADNSNNKDFWIKRLAIAIKLNNHWASGIGFNQFSNVSYNFFGTRSAEGSAANYLTYYEGDGGLNEYYWNNALSLGKHFSIGLKSSIIAGAINQTETVADESLAAPISTKVQDYFGKPRFQTGAIYSAALNKKWDVSVGGRFSPQVKMTSERTLTVTEGGTPIIEDEFIKNDRFSLPNTYAAGIAIKHNNKTTFAADYTYEDWSSLKIKEPGWQLISNNLLSAGIEFSRQARHLNQVVEKRFFQIGGFYNSSYLQVKNEPVKEFGFTAGMGGVIGKGLLYTLSLEAGSRGTTQQKLIKENYVQFSISFSFRDFLASQGRKYD